MTNLKQCQAQLIIPLSLNRLRMVQDAVRSIAVEYGFDEQRLNFMDLAIEEVIGTILRFITDQVDLADARLHIDIEMDLPIFRVIILNRGLPFDLSHIPQYDVSQTKKIVAGQGASSRDINEKTFEAGLALFILKNSVDRYRINNCGKDGIAFELEWLAPASRVADLEEFKDLDCNSDLALKPTEEAKKQAPQPPEPADEIRLLADNDAANLACLIYRTYGNTYPKEDFYFPDRICAHFESGRIKSWGALTPSNRIAGHIALMKGNPADQAVEWGMAVVDPLWRSAGLMKKMLSTIIADMPTRSETVLFAQAVTNHPFTQKTCRRYDFAPTALMLAYISETVRFRGITEKLGHRESIFVETRLFKPLPGQPLYPPKNHFAAIKRILAGMGINLEDLIAPEHARPKPADTISSLHIVNILNIASIDVSQVGADFGKFLPLTQQRLFKERVDMIYITFDLSDPGVEDGVRQAEDLGFFLAGLLPMQPFPYSLTLQYPNIKNIDFEGITTDGEQTAWLKQTVLEERNKAALRA